MRAVLLTLLATLVVGCDRDPDADVPDAKPLDPAKRQTTPQGGGAHPTRRGSDREG